MSEAEDPLAPLTVAEFSQRMTDLFHKVPRFRNIAVSGEITGFRPSASAIYFDLKDQGAQGGPMLACFLRAERLPHGIELADGLAVIARGEIINYGPRGRYSLTVREIEATGLGLLFVEFQALKERLKREGLFNDERKRTLPRFPRKLAVVSTREGKGIDDFVREIEKRGAFVRVQLFDTRVQGVGAERDIAAAIGRADRSGADLIILGRGGGSYEDLFPFNREEVVRAIVAARTPVLTAIGHSADIHLADLAADERANTPSLAADRVLAGWMKAAEWLPKMNERLLNAAERRIDLGARGIELRARTLGDTIARRLATKQSTLVQRERGLVALDPRARLAGRAAAIATRSEQLSAASAALLRRAATRMDASKERLPERVVGLVARKRSLLDLGAAAMRGADPSAPLQRGYAIVLRDGVVVRNAAQLRAGDDVRARFGRGSACARIESIESEEGEA
ncbi:MAG: exodeoxyribonuclease VII large subunit [Candidatus Eremiobacteraeota bacterium]|nr:exodeoxyribonuclease VII large subunit [Candidatus Eremiobacteraeota bacterium]NNM92540.1 exodeoxyribonuclease VII large subunit [Candidatus Eremiobacteraeota bacterium]